jgi:hypothetical protein
MHRSPSRRAAAVGSIFVMIGLLALAGCHEDEITHAVVPRSAPPEKTRLVGVIYPHGPQTWFFKLMGPESAFEGVLDPFDAFVQSVRFTDKPDAPVTWTLPEGWKAEPPGDKVYAAFRIPDKALKLTVSVLPKKEEGEVFYNVNRWRKQLGLDEVSEAGLEALKKDKSIQELQINADVTTLVDMTGAARGKQTAKAPAWTYDKPEEWVEEPHPEMRTVRAEAIFKITGEGQTAEASVTALGGKAGGLEQNVERWCRQIDAPALGPDQLSKLPTITVAGRESPYVDVTGKKGRTIGAIVSVGDKTWFFKLNGPAELVEKQKPTFEAFLKSVKFDAGMGGEQ